MPLTRFALFILLAAGITPFSAAVGVETTTLRGRDSNPSFAFRVPRGVVVEIPVDPLCSRTPVLIDDHCMTVQMISTGDKLVPIETDEGEAIAAERAVNHRSDGSIRHRQHHRECFPRC